MLLVVAALALAAQTAPSERTCISDALDADQRVNLAERFIHGEMDLMLSIAQPAAEACAAKWKWNDARREWHIVHNAAVFAMLRLEAQLPEAFTEDRLEGLFLKLPEADRYGFSLSGSAALEPAAYAALVGRAGAILAAEKLSPMHIEIAGQWFIAYARYAEAVMNLKASDPAG